jgi:TonB family protein
MGSPADAAYADWMQQAIAASEQMEGAFGTDIRGHRLSQDVRDFCEVQRSNVRTVPVDSSAADTLYNQQSQQYHELQQYWRQYPSLTHNRDMWSTFLARNGMPPTTPHENAVTVAENALRSALDGGVPSPEWSLRAQELHVAYVQERSHSLRARPIAAASFRQRVSPCSPPADKTTGKKSPTVARMNGPLEDYWPPESKRLGEEGVVMASLRVSATGCATAAAISGSSGSEMLDEAVMQFYETIDFIPSEIDGKPVESTPTLPVNFKLQK